MSPRKPVDEKKGTTVRVSMTAAEAEDVARRARASGISGAEYVRQAVRAYPTVQRGDSAPTVERS